jgi:AGCS family alanine or glycine:cation symporter
VLAQFLPKAGWIASGITGTLEDVINWLNGYIWAWPAEPWPPLLVVLLVGSGVFITIRLGGIQFFKFGHAIKSLRGHYDSPEDRGDIKPHEALTSALSATVGIGNIAGVATAIHYGGPGALFWMWITAIFGMALKYTECLLAHHYRVIHEDGSISGGPMYYIERGLGKSWKPLAIMFAVFTVISSFGAGNMVQAFTVSDSWHTDFGIPNWVTGLLTTSIVFAVIVGGIKRIGHVTAKLVPLMAAIYMLGALIILGLHAGEITGAFGTIFREAFNPTAGVSGVAGGIIVTLLWGVKRGLFSNESGQGSAPIAHAAAKNKSSVRQASIAMLGPLIDTLLICTMTGLVIIVTGAYQVLDPATGETLNSSPLTAAAFKMGMFGNWGNLIVTISVFLFAISTAISWSYYGDRAAEYLAGPKAIPVYRLFYVGFHFLGSLLALEWVWGFGDVALGLMTFPNLIAILALSGVAVKLTKDYFKNLEAAGNS